MVDPSQMLSGKIYILKESGIRWIKNLQEFLKRFLLKIFRKTSSWTYLVGVENFSGSTWSISG